MSTEFLISLPPPGPLLTDYDRSKTSTSQPSPVPPAFLDAMSVREDVFVREQSVPLENEFDADDPRSWHWITYASVGASHASSSSSPSTTTSTQQGTTPNGHNPTTTSSEETKATASRLAVGTVRLVPPPHPPHPEPGSAHQIDNSEASASAPAQPHTHAPSKKVHSDHNPTNEPYIKLGRLAILKPYRKLGLARLLVDGALEWAGQHAEDIVPPTSATDREAKRVSVGSAESGEGGAEEGGTGGDGIWRGLVLVHSQKHLERVYGKWGFVRDESLGEWDEEGIAHIGMWRRVKVRERGGKV